MGRKARANREKQAARKAHARRFLFAVMEAFRTIRRRREPMLREKFPNAKPGCATCAFNPATDKMQGQELTAFNLVKAIDEDRPFYCHSKMAYTKGSGWVPPMKIDDEGRSVVDTERMELCAALAASRAHLEAR